MADTALRLKPKDVCDPQMQDIAQKCTSAYSPGPKPCTKIQLRLDNHQRRHRYIITAISPDSNFRSSFTNFIHNSSSNNSGNLSTMPAKTPQLWIAPSTCSLLPHILIREAGIDFSLFKVDIISNYGFPEEYTKINPKKRVPILEIGDGEVVTETVAISTWISQQAPEKKLFGTTDLHTVRVYEWFNWLSGTVHERGFGCYFRPSGVVEDEAAFDGARRLAAAWIERCFGEIEDRLEGEHAVDDVFTAADIFLYVIYRWANMLGWHLQALYPKYTRLVEKVSQREAVLAAIKEEGIPLIKDNRGGDWSRDPRLPK